MFLVSRTVETRIVCVLLTSGIFVASLPSFAAVSEPSQEALAVAHQNDEFAAHSVRSARDSRCRAHPQTSPTAGTA